MTTQVQTQTRIFDWPGLRDLIHELRWEGLPGNPQTFVIDATDEQRHAFVRIAEAIASMNGQEPQDEQDEDEATVAITLPLSDWQRIDEAGLSTAQDWEDTIGEVVQ